MVTVKHKRQDSDDRNTFDDCLLIVMGPEIVIKTAMAVFNVDLVIICNADVHK